ncbi:hypothetical protein POM88_028945 [Heracleum sosnowskyi]|uniref:Uncharacterized protein n=1 Tax=Heracleum sosnowskyi TaxID=360622 RepID=A0AAD8MH76_9APIA|nr:hypothetical protein POM88_028945 [Heracleum sosnowskyi]
MFWAMSYMTGQSACDTVISWLTSGGTELLSASNLQSSDRIMVIREVNPVPISLLSGLSIHMCLKLASQLEETMFSGQVVASREVNCTSLNELLELLYLSQLNPFQEEQMFSACIAGRRFLILNFLKDPEKRRKMIILLS